jgi:uncharacterized radical SAM superfamily protein
MLQLSSESIWSLSQPDLVKFLDSKALIQKNPEIRFYTPNFTCHKSRLFCSSMKFFPTISITGTSCGLNCKHCGGNVLATMQPAITPNELIKVCSKLKQDGVVGCLISGGCLPDGMVPLKAFVEAFAQVKHELGLTVFVHTGLIDLETAILLKQSAAVDAVLIDVIGSQVTINNVYKLNVTVNDYAKSLGALQNTGLSFVPHVVVGLNGGKLDGEYAALQMISQANPSAVVIIAFTPLLGTEMAKIEPPQPLDIARVAATARVMFPKTPIALGCMRPKGKLRAVIDELALKSGVDAIAFPSQTVINFAKTQGWATSFSPYCCAKISTDLNLNKKVLNQN